MRPVYDSWQFWALLSAFFAGLTVYPKRMFFGHTPAKYLTGNMTTPLVDKARN